MSFEPKKKSSHHGDRLPRDGHTGMSAATQRHFADVQQKMINYVSEQELLQYDAQPRHFHHHSEHLFVDGQKAPKTHSSPSKSFSSSKHSSHSNHSTPTTTRRHGKH